MHDAAYKQLFARPRMVRDLLEGFAARGWSGSLDFGTLEPVPASYVSRDLQQRHGDLVWRVRFSDERWLYLLLLLEFQSTVDPGMAVRMLAYTALLYQRLAADGALRDPGALPPVLPVVIYNGRGSWTARTEVSELVAGGGGELSPYQPSQRYFLLDGGRLADGALPSGNLVSALIGLEKGRDPAVGGGALAGSVQGADRPPGRRGGRRAEAGVRDVDHAGGGAVGSVARRGSRAVGAVEGDVHDAGRNRPGMAGARPCPGHRAGPGPRASSRAATKNGPCCVAWPPESSVATPPTG